MSELNSIEKQLRGWNPRQPSPEIAARVFGAARQATPELGLNAGEFWRWMIPALGCLMLVASTLTSKLPDGQFSLAQTNAAFLLNSPDASPQFLRAEVSHSEINSLPITSVERSLGQRPESGVVSFVRHHPTNLIR